MTAPGDIYRRTAYGDHVLITEVKIYSEGVYRFRWYELENDVWGWYTNPHGDELGDTGHDIFRRVA